MSFLITINSTEMRKEKLLLLLVVFLVVLNGITLILVIQNQRPPRLLPHDLVIIERLGFDHEQAKEFEVLKRRHRKRIDSIDAHFRNALEDYFLLMKTPLVDTLAKAEIEGRLLELERQKVSVTFDHFLELKNLCKPDKQDEFDAFIPELVNFILPPAPHKRKNFKKF
jgi:hypothetical protein